MRGAAMAAALAIVAACGVRGPADFVRAGDVELASESVPGARKAAAHYQEALKRAPSAAIHEKLRRALSIAGDAEGAKRELQRAAELFDRAGDADSALVARAQLAGGDVEALKKVVAEARDRKLDQPTPVSQSPASQRPSTPSALASSGQTTLLRNGGLGHGPSGHFMPHGDRAVMSSQGERTRLNRGS